LTFTFFHVSVFGERGILMFVYVQTEEKVLTVPAILAVLVVVLAGVGLYKAVRILFLVLQFIFA